MDRCAACPNAHKCIPGDGPQRQGEPLFITEAPGKDEERVGRILVGRTGQELDQHYLPLAGLKRSQVRLTNAIKCWPTTPGHKLDSKRPADRRLLGSCSNILMAEIDELQPRLLVPLGAFACLAIDPALDLEIDHGRPVMTQWGIPAFPMWHPARGMHEPKKMLDIRTDWMRLKSYLRNQLDVPVDEYPEPDYAEVTDPAEIECIDYTRPIGCDTETSRRLGPYCLTYSQEAGTGRLIRAGRRDLLDALQAVLDKWQSVVLFHNWFYDYAPVGALQLSIPRRAIRDTMVRAYHLGNLPQGLKALADRELGMKMQDFDDLVRPYSTKQVLDYYKLAQLFDWPKPEASLERDSKTGQWKLYQPQSMNTKLKRFFTDYENNPEKDPFAMWDDNWVNEQAMIEEKCGPWPGLDIAHVPFEKVLHYACRDADALIRLNPILEHMRSRVRQFPQEQWRAA